MSLSRDCGRVPWALAIWAACLTAIFCSCSACLFSAVLALLVDTSGSISQQDLNQFASEMHGLLAAYKTELMVIYVDAAVQGVEFIASDDTEINLELKGGGGTDYRPGYDWLQKQGHMPTAAVYLTDGYCNSFPDEPDFPTLWALTQKSDYFKPAFGEILVINRDE